MSKPRVWMILLIALLVASACGGQAESQTPEPTLAPTAAEPAASAAAPDSGASARVETFVPHVYQTLSNPDRSPEDVASLMGASFDLATWQSEGSTYTDPAQAASVVMDCCLPTEGSIGQFATGRDITDLLGTDPVQMFPNGVHFQLGTGWGPEGGGEAVLVFSLAADGATYYWSGLLFAPDGFASQPIVDLRDMETSLKQALYEREVDSWSLYFDTSFVVAGYQSEASEYGADRQVEALDHLLSIYPPEGYLLAYPDPRAEGVEMAAQLVELFPEALDFIFSTGWGPDGQGEVWLVIGQSASDGGFVWHAILYAPQGFPRG